MKNISLFDYIDEYLDDSYAMNVLYSSIQQSIVESVNDSTKGNVIMIDGRFLGEPIIIKLLMRGNPIKNLFSLLLSVRILMVNPNYFELCEDDRLLFYPKPSDNFEWVGYLKIINDCIDDDDTFTIYSLFEAVCTDGSLTEKEMNAFKSGILIPEFRNVKTYYVNLANRRKGVGDDFIGNLAFVESGIEEYTVNKNIKFVGDTAFAFCDSLTSIYFEDKVLFGRLPIIECPKLRVIKVPEELVDYYKSELPYLADIITSNKENAVDINVENEKSCVSFVAPDESQENFADIKESNKCIDISIDFRFLERVFDKKVTSYKYLWMIAILSLAKEQNAMNLTFRDLVIRMASFAWPLLFDDELDFGPNDRMRAYLSSVMKKTTLIAAASQNVVEKYLSQHYESQGIAAILSPLLKNVPYRFLSPWIQFTTTEEVIEKSNSRSYTGLYALNEKSILLDEDWWEYIEENYDKIFSFTINSFLEYLGSHNSQLKLLRLKMKLLK